MIKEGLFMNKKIVSAVLCLILVVGCLTAVAACDKDGKEKLSIVYLGDSIGEAVAEIGRAHV